MACPIAWEHGQEPILQKASGSKRRFIQVSVSPPPLLGAMEMDWNGQSAKSPSLPLSLPPWALVSAMK